MPKRNDYISWDEYFVGLLKVTEMRSKDPDTQVASLLVDEKNRIISTGYNGFPQGCSDDVFPWERSDNFMESKYTFVVHAEQNCIVSSPYADLSNCKMYVSLCPCPDCAKLIIQSGIKEIIYLNKPDNLAYRYDATDKMFTHTGVRAYQYNPSGKQIEFSL